MKEEEEEVRECDGSRGGADAARSARRENWLLCLHKRGCFPPSEPSFRPLPRRQSSQEEPPRTRAARRADSLFARFVYGISRANSRGDREIAGRGTPDQPASAVANSLWNP